MAATPPQIDIAAQPLASALSELAKKFGKNLIFDSSLVKGLSGRALHGQTSIEAALERLLTPSGLTFVMKPDGAILIKRQPPKPNSVLAEAPPPIPEILVVGRRTLNVDLVRSENDIQPYQIMNAATIEEAGAQTLDEIFKSRLASNAQALLSNQMSVLNNGSTRSQIDLRGLGTDQTLVLVDGHRLPSYPEVDEFGQSDINGIPLNAIDRVEILPSTAAGIYGPGASGGVVNIILKHDASGIDLGFTQGITARGDAPNWRIQAHAGFTSTSGATKADLFYEHSADTGLSVDQRPYVENARIARFTNLEAASNNGTFISNDQLFPLPYSNSINISSGSNVPLMLAPQLGGGSIESPYTFIPLADNGTSQEAAILRANAGKLDFSSPNNGGGLQQSLLTRTNRNGGVLTLRQRLSNNIEAFVDATASRDTGTAIGGLEYQNFNGNLYIYEPDSPVTGGQTSYPPFANTGTYSTTTTSIQATAGLIGALPHHWQAEADLTGGYLKYRSLYPAPDYGVPDPDPFAGAAALQQYESAIQPWPYVNQSASDRLMDANIRLAGPLLQLPAGQAFLTLLGEIRSDTTSEILYSAIAGFDPSYSASIATATTPTQNLNDKSIYAELRSPIISHDSSILLLRGLDIQAAVRADRYIISLPHTNTIVGQPNSTSIIGDGDNLLGGFSVPITDVMETITRNYGMMAFTLGAKVEPVDGLVFRSSIATGAQPPDLSFLASGSSVETGSPQGTDPKRDNQEVTGIYDTGGPTALKPSRYKSFLVGAIITPRAIPTLRLSIDYTHISQDNDIYTLLGQYYETAQYFLDNESAFPGRVTRAPLTVADAAKGYTGGVVTAINGAPTDSASSRLDTLDFNLRYSWSSSLGQFSLSSQFNWIPHFVRRTTAVEAWYSAVGYVDGPPPWKGNVEIDWRKGSVSAGANVQLFGPYNINLAPATIGGQLVPGVAPEDYIAPLESPSNIEPVQAYVDVFVNVRVKTWLAKPAVIRFSCQNMFDRSPPVFVPVLEPQSFSDFGLGYSYFGDPRGRRFELNVTAYF